MQKSTRLSADQFAHISRAAGDRRLVENLTSGFAKPLAQPAMLMEPEWLQLSTPTWIEHIPFAFWLMEQHRPRQFVELGTYCGNSYFAFLQAAKALNLPTRCFAVDTWSGEEHLSIGADTVYAAVSSHNEAKYGGFSRLQRMGFDEARPHFIDGSIDLLHIDGVRTYEASKKNFEAWLPKLSSRAIVLFHDTNIYEQDFGVHRLWAELCEHYPHFEFLHGNGLGVLGLGSEIEGEIADLLMSEEDPRATSAVRDVFWRAASGIRLQRALHYARAETARLNAIIASKGEHRATVPALISAVSPTTAAIGEQSNAARRETERLASLLSEQSASLVALREEIDERDETIVKLRKDVAEQKEQLVQATSMLAEREKEVLSMLTSLSNVREQVRQGELARASHAALLGEKDAALSKTREELRLRDIAIEETRTESQSLGVLQNERTRLEQRCSELTTQLRELHADSQAREQTMRQELERVHEAYKETASWKLTAPFRSVKLLPRRIKLAVTGVPRAFRGDHNRSPNVPKGAGRQRDKEDGRRAQGAGANDFRGHSLQNQSSGGEARNFQIDSAAGATSPGGGVLRSEGRSGKPPVKPVLGMTKRKPSVPLEFVPKVEERFDLEASRIRLIAFYQPHLHSTAGHDVLRGGGTKAWSHVSKAVPQFAGHYQPHIPGELGFYDARQIDVQRQQIDLAKHYGIHGWCFYHYSNGGSGLHEGPLDQLLAHRDLDMPFCLCWANQASMIHGAGDEGEGLLAQHHSPDDDVAFIADCARAFRDPRYIRFRNRPVLIVYHIDLLPEPAATAQRWREYCRREGLGDPYLVVARYFSTRDPREYGFDAALELPPHELSAAPINDRMKILNPDYEGNVYDYNDLVHSYLANDEPGYPLLKTVATGWDTEARDPGKGATFDGATAASYAHWLRGACDYAASRAEADASYPALVFVHAWNDWSNGAHLEPDRQFGYAKLHASGSVLQDFRRPDHALRAEVGRSQRSFKKASKNAVIVHLGSDSMLDEVLPYLRNAEGIDLLVSLGVNVGIECVRRLRSHFPNAYLVTSPNRGRDVAPFLELLGVFQSYGYELGCKIHAIKWPQRDFGSLTMREAIASLLGSFTIVLDAQSRFSADSGLGMLVPSSSLIDLSEQDRNEPSRKWLDELLPRLGCAEMIGSYGWQFVAGAMFWFRSDALSNLQQLDLSTFDFEDELGQVDGTLADAIERLISLCCVQSGYDVGLID